MSLSTSEAKHPASAQIAIRGAIIQNINTDIMDSGFDSVRDGSDRIEICNVLHQITHLSIFYFLFYYSAAAAAP